MAALLLLLGPLAAAAEPAINKERARFNYQMFCQGCHTGDGMGYKSVPVLKGFVGHFLASQAGREYLVRVPGAANSALASDKLAEVLNWIVVTFGADSIPANWQFYRAEEVAQYRKNPLFEVVEYRQQLVTQLLKNSSENAL